MLWIVFGEKNDALLRTYLGMIWLLSLANWLPTRGNHEDFRPGEDLNIRYKRTEVMKVEEITKF